MGFLFLTSRMQRGTESGTRFYREGKGARKRVEGARGMLSLCEMKEEIIKRPLKT